MTMSTVGGMGFRVAIYWAGAALLTVLGLTLVVAAVTAGGGVAVAVLGVPPLLVAAALARGWRWSRVVGVVVGVTYMLAIGFVATTPWRGLTPPPGQSPAPLEPGLVVLTVVFALASVLVGVGASPDATRRAP
jgi:hypothetical protein